MNTATERVLAYHQRTKHQPQRYAAGPDTLDWDAQPNPFRDWLGAPSTPLPLVADGLGTTWGRLFATPGVPPRALDVEAVACLLELSFGLTAWKQYGPDRWALRANPSSGNLHPTEVYVLAVGVTGLTDGLYHYAPREHALVRRASCVPDPGDVPERGLWLGLSSIQWREAWKYGERAFRYCQLDAGHALGALRYAAAAQGWQARVVDGLGHAELAAWMGLDREADFGDAEREEPELFVQVGPPLTAGHAARTPRVRCTEWAGQASRLDARPMYRWPVINEVAQATRAVVREAAPADVVSGGVANDEASEMAIEAAGDAPSDAARAGELAATLIRGRRSAQHFDRRASLPLPAFMRIAQALMPRAQLPWDVWTQPVRVHPVLYAHRVDGLTPGAYVLPRSRTGEALLRQHIQAGTAWSAVADAPPGLPLWRLAEHPALAGALRTLSCHQAIASDAGFAVSLLAEFAQPLEHDAALYRAVLREAGLIGQALYLGAEAEGLRGTGIGCYFDDAVHELLGLQGSTLQVLYHFTVGVPVVDTRIATEPPYAHRAASVAA
jgi:SagB-type dehydrogenase family enzyme